MKKSILTLILIATMFASSCSDFLEIVPKGATLLNNLNDLELLAIGSYEQSCWSYNDQGMLVNDIYGTQSSFMTNLTNTNTTTYAYMAYDETVDRAALTESSTAYSRNYSSICALNEVIIATPKVSGNEIRKSQLVAQAKVKRAYFHYLIAITFCRQYDASTAASEGGIPYVEDLVVATINKKLTLQETYDKLLADCSDEILEALPDEPTNVLLPGKAFGYAVRAKILLQMKDYTNALTYALTSLQYNPAIEDRRGVVSNPTSFGRLATAPNYLIYAAPTSNGAGTCYLSYETAQLFEEGDILKNYGIVTQTPTKTTYVWNPTTITGLSQKVLCWSPGSKSRDNTGGITSDQMYYIAAECYIRTGKITQGLNLVNQVRRYRIAPDKYVDLTAATEADAMQKLMKCKRIECLFTYNNYADIKRWNTESAYRRTITKTLNGNTYTLSPDSPLWVFPFPADATKFNSTLTQNY